MFKKLIAVLLLAVMVLGCFAGCKTNTDDPDKDTSGDTSKTDKEERKIEEGTSVILGNITEVSGDFRWPGFGGSSAGAADQDINRLTQGYATMESDQSGKYVWSDTVVKSHTEKETEEGNLEITIEINEGLKFSDGTEIKAANYVAYVLAFSSPVSQQAGHTGLSGQSFVGYENFNAYCGADVEVEGATKEFAGVRLLGDYKFSLTVDAAAGFYPYYFANTYGAISPDPLDLLFGDDVEIKDDGKGCYLSETFYAKAADSKDDAVSFAKAAHIEASRYDWKNYPFSGAYTIAAYDESKKEVTLKANPNFKGNFEGMTPSIETIVYVWIISETQLDQLKTGGVDVLSGITGGEDTKAALAIVDNVNFSETHYQRAGYGKIEFECDFGPTMFKEVRQAITYLLDRTEFCSSFTGGYGVVVEGPYSPDFSMWKAVKDEIEINSYEYSLTNAKKVLEEGGWVYNSKGEAYVEGQTGVDSVRYKKLTAEEAAVVEGVNKTYASVSNTDGITYKTVEINGEYYMPLAINWLGTTPNDVTDLLQTTLANSSDISAAGMVIRSEVGDFTKLLGEIYREASYGYSGTPTYGMFNLATGWNSSVYDYAFNWSLDPDYFSYSSNKLYDEYDVAFPYDLKAEKLTYAEAVEQSGDKLGMDYLSMAMVYNATTEDEYNEWWKAYIERWNELMPDIPLYSNYYYDVYNAKIENFETTPFFGPARAILYSNVK